jgi:hypothetical protein
MGLKTCDPFLLAHPMTAVSLGKNFMKNNNGDIVRRAVKIFGYSYREKLILW